MKLRYEGVIFREVAAGADSVVELFAAWRPGNDNPALHEALRIVAEQSTGEPGPGSMGAA